MADDKRSDTSRNARDDGGRESMGVVRKWISDHPNVWEFILFNVLSNISTITRFVVAWIGTAYRVLWRRRDEHDDDAFIALPDTPRGLHAVHIGHFDIKQEDVIHRRITLHDLGTILEDRDGETLTALLGETLDIIENRSSRQRIILDDANTNILHAVAYFHIRIALPSPSPRRPAPVNEPGADGPAQKGPPAPNNAGTAETLSPHLRIVHHVSA